MTGYPKTFLVQNLSLKTCANLHKKFLKHITKIGSRISLRDLERFQEGYSRIHAGNCLIFDLQHLQIVWTTDYMKSIPKYVNFEDFSLFLIK